MKPYNFHMFKYLSTPWEIGLFFTNRRFLLFNLLCIKKSTFDLQDVRKNDNLCKA